MQDKKRNFITIYCCIVFVTALYLTFTLTSEPKAIEPKFKPSPQISGYTVKELDGKIAIFENGNNEPLRVLESPFVHDLPSFDRQLLKEGIIAHNESELIEILEDYDY